MQAFSVGQNLALRAVFSAHLNRIAHGGEMMKSNVVMNNARNLNCVTNKIKYGLCCIIFYIRTRTLLQYVSVLLPGSNPVHL